MFNFGIIVKDLKLKTETEKIVENLVQLSSENTIRLIQKSNALKNMANDILSRPGISKLKKI